MILTIVPMVQPLYQLVLLLHSQQFQPMETLYTSSSPLMTCTKGRTHPRYTQGQVAAALPPNSTLLQLSPAPTPPQHTADSLTI